MTSADLIEHIRAMIPSTTLADDTILTYLNFAETEIKNWYGSDTFPEKYRPVQAMACVVGIGLIGGVGENSHSENGVNRTFNYSDMIEYIHRNVIPLAKI